MKSTHRTHFLFIHPINPPSIEPIEDELTEKVDFIFSNLKPTQYYRGFHVTPFGKHSEPNDYGHDILPIVSNSLAPYYIRHHREDISPKQIEWIHELYEILKNAAAYYRIDVEKPVYYLKFYERDGVGYGNAMTYVLEAIGTLDGINHLIKNTFFKELTEQEFNDAIKLAKGKYPHESEGCTSITVYDVLKSSEFSPY